VPQDDFIYYAASVEWIYNVEDDEYIYIINTGN